MTNLIRDVLFPSIASIGLLTAAVADLAVAREAPPAEIAASSALSTDSANASRSTPIDSTAAYSGEAPTVPESDRRGSGVEPRCERTERIGKFAITRCD